MILREVFKEAVRMRHLFSTEDDLHPENVLSESYPFSANASLSLEGLEFRLNIMDI